MFSISLQEFKKLYILEYLHRLWGRMIGFAVIFPLIVLSLKKVIDKTWVKYFITFIFLIFVQGVLGWLMVRTGIVEDRIFVSPIFLALHNTFALGLYSFVLYGIYKSKTTGKEVVSQNEVINQNIASKNYEEAGFSPDFRRIKMLSLIAILIFVFQFIFTKRFSKQSSIFKFFSQTFCSDFRCGFDFPCFKESFFANYSLVNAVHFRSGNNFELKRGHTSSLGSFTSS